MEEKKKGEIEFTDYERQACNGYLCGLMLEERDGSQEKFLEDERVAALIKSDYEAGKTNYEAAEHLDNAYYKWANGNEF